MTRRHLHRVLGSLFAARLIRAESAKNSFFAPYSELERLAGQAHSNQKGLRSELDIEDSIGQLINAVFAIPRGFEIPSNLRELTKPILTSAHQKHEARRLADPSSVTGVHEEQIASRMSDFFNRMKAPAAAQVTAHQVHVIRILSLSRNPIFMGEGMTTALSKAGASISPYLSPLQATHLTLMVTEQKLFNPDYQLKPDAREIDHRASGEAHKTRYSAFVRSDEFGVKLSEVLAQEFEQMTNADVISLLSG